MTTQEAPIIPVTPRKRRWWLWLIASPFLLFLLAIILLYLPPVQRFAVDKASTLASQSTGLDITVGRLDLRFPLDLVVSDVLAVDSLEKDTLLSLERLKVELRFWKLLKKEIEIEEISLRNAIVHSRDFIDGMEVNGRLGELFLESHGVIFSPETARVNEFSVKNTDLSLSLYNMEDADTTASEPVYWKILLDKVDFENVGLALKMPQDSLFLRTKLAKTSLKDGIIDLKEASYFLKTFSIQESSLAYDMGLEASRIHPDSLGQTLNPSHLNFESVDLQIDSVYYCGKDIRANIARFDWVERSGLELVSAEGRIVADSTLIHIPKFAMKTTASSLDLQSEISWDVLEMKRSGLLSARFLAEFGKEDMVKLVGGMDPEFVKSYPLQPLRILTGIDGNLNRLHLRTFSAELPHAFKAQAEGDLLHLTDSTRRGGEINLSAEAFDMRFLRPLTEGGVAIPRGTKLDGIFTMQGPKMGADFLLKQPEAKAITLVDSTQLTVHNDTLSLAEDFQMRRAARLYAQYDLSKDAYLADLVVNDLDVHQFLPKDSIFDVAMNLHADGEGLDFFAPEAHFNIRGTLDKMHYTSYRLGGYVLQATLASHQLDASLQAQNSAMEVDARLDAKLKPNDVAAHFTMQVPKLDWQVMKLMEVPFLTSHQFDVSFVSDLQKKYVVDASMTDTSVRAPKRTFKTKDLFVGFATSVDSTKAYMRAGDLDVNFEGKGYVENILQQVDAFTTRAGAQWTSKTIDQEELKTLLPGICLKATSGKDNPIGNYLSMMQGISFDKLYMDLDISPEEGINGEAYLYHITTDSLSVDTLGIDLEHGAEGLDFFAEVISTPKPKQEAFEIDLDGNVGNGKAKLLLQYLNAKKEKGIYLGLDAALGRRGIRMKFFPENPTLVFRPFNLNARNYLYLADRGRIYGDVRLSDEQGTGIHFYTNREDTIADQEMTVELSRIALQQFKRVIPYMPDMAGWLGGSLHYVDSQGQMMLSADVRVDDFVYEESPLGNWEMSGVYLPGDSSRHHVDGFLMHNDQEIVYMNGIYQADALGNENITGDLELQHFPLPVLNPFIPEKMVEFTGDIDGTLSMAGSPMKPVLNGGLKLDSVNMIMPDMSIAFRFDDKQVDMVDSKMIFDKFNIYTKGDTPFAINGSVDFSDMEKMLVDLRMKTNDYELMNAPKNRKATTYGKIYVDVDATLKGPVDELKMRGNMNVLGKTDFTYVLKDSPLMVDDRLGSMVEFVNFNDTVTVDQSEKQPVTLTGMDIAMTIHIDQAVQAHVDLTADGSNYMEVEGGGDLAFQYTPQGEMLLNGRYSLISGELKYEIPIIPLKTFSIQNGSYLNWTGNMMNPEMNIKATERIRANVGSEGEASRMVSFDVGIALTDRLENLGLAFTLEAPEDGSVQEQLNAMSAEERGKLAVTMLVTGMYMAEGNSTGGYNVNNALNSFLQNQISNVVGQSMDISLGMEKTNDAEGGRGTDYNFQFAKRFWNNRFRIVIGGTVSTGNAAQKDETFIDNVAIEYRLDDSGTRYVKLFHEKNYESVLEGEVIETGIGVVLRKKVSNLGELFIFKKKKDDEE
ncbi:MAG: translocation/assembly module TamB domain-containing protein [Bacteroides sp.]|nr:translocation/assembly module TamB domain-containing protein [Bacteroides sp.]